MASRSTTNRSCWVVGSGPVKNQPAAQPEDRQLYDKHPLPLDAHPNASYYQVAFLCLWLAAWPANRPFRPEAVSNERVMVVHLTAPQHPTLRNCKNLVVACAGSEKIEFTSWARYRPAPLEGRAAALRWRTVGPFAKVAQISIRSAMLRASSSSTPKYRTVLSIFV